MKNKKNRFLSLSIIPFALIGTGGIINVLDSKQNIETNNIKETKEIINQGVVKELQLGQNNSGVILSDPLGNDYLYMWGYDIYGEVGDSSEISSDRYVETPKLIASTNSETFSGGEFHNLMVSYHHSSVIFTDESGIDHLYTWGYNNDGQLGNGESSIEVSYLPTEIYSGSIKDVALGSEHSMMITTDSLGVDHLLVWGSNSIGQLGNTELGVEVLEPQEIFSIPGMTIKDIDAGQNFSGAVLVNQETGNESLYTWGANGSGQLGITGSTGSFMPFPQKMDFPEETKFKEINFGSEFASVWTEEGKLYTWGSNSYGQLGIEEVPEGVSISNAVEVTMPEEADGGEIKDVDFGNFTSAMIIEGSDGKDSLYTWGNDEHGQLGNDKPLINKNSPTKVDLGDDVTDIKNVQLGAEHSFAVVTDSWKNDHLYGWGKNNWGQLGTSEVPSGVDVENNEIPVPIETTFWFNLKPAYSLFLEKNDKDKATFQIGISTLLEGFVPSEVNVYNSNKQLVGETKLIEENGSLYTFELTISDETLVDNQQLYWSVDQGETLNLISEEVWNLNNNFFRVDNIWMYLMFSIILFLIILFIWIVALASRK